MSAHCVFQQHMSRFWSNIFFGDSELLAFSSSFHECPLCVSTVHGHLFISLEKLEYKSIISLVSGISFSLNDFWAAS